MRVICIDDSNRGLTCIPVLVKQGQEYEIKYITGRKGVHVEGVTPHAHNGIADWDIEQILLVSFGSVVGLLYLYATYLQFSYWFKF